MNTPEIWRILNYLPKHIIIIGFGDFKQCKGINGFKKFDKSRAFLNIFGGNRVTLKKQCRANISYANACVEFYDTGIVPAIGEFDPDTVDDHICITNKKRVELNNQVIDRLAEEKSIKQIPLEKRMRFLKKTKKGRRHIRTTERCDVDKLAYLVRNQDKFPQIVDSHDSGKNCFVIPYKYLANQKKDENGEWYSDVTYYQSNADHDGRYYSEGSQSLQNITRQIRHTIAADYYVDIDMVNAHPRILDYMCRKHGQVHRPMLTDYVKNREAIITMIRKQFGLNRQDTKQMLLAIMNGGYGKTQKYCINKWVADFTAETKLIHQDFCTKYPERFEKQRTHRLGKCINGCMCTCVCKRKCKVADRQSCIDGTCKNNCKGKSKFHRPCVGKCKSPCRRDWNIEASFNNILMCEYENKMLQIMYGVLTTENLVNKKEVVLCFDGIMVSKDHQNKVTPELLTRMEDAVKNVFPGLNIGLEVKPMEEGLIMPVVDKYMGVLPHEVGLVDHDSIDEFPCLFEGMKVMGNQNCKTSRKHKDYLYTNNQLFVIAKCNEKSVALTSDDYSIVISTDDLKRHFRPSYAKTVWKVQGATIDTKYAIHQFDKMVDREGDHNNGYVALTRGTDPSNICVVGTNNLKKEHEHMLSNM
jgi:hypothetical protein